MLLWAGDVSVEERAAYDLPWQGVIQMVEASIDERDQGSVVDAIAHRRGVQPTELGNPAAWTDSQELRAAIGKTAKEKGWFKRIDLGEDLGNIMAEHMEGLAGTDLRSKLEVLRQWADGDD